MERVAFIVERTDERLDCLLNPESVVWQRRAGVRTRRSLGEAMTPGTLRDDPVLWAGGGRSELTLDLLFDLSLVASPSAPKDVRKLTRPLHDLADQGRRAANDAAAPVARFVWGKAWNVRCVVVAVAERFEQFTAAGLPRRSWMRLRLRRVDRPASATATVPAPRGLRLRADAAERARTERIATAQVIGGPSSSDAPSVSRLDVIAEQRYGHAGYWRLLAQFNDIDAPAKVPSGFRLRLPPTDLLEPRS